MSGLWTCSALLISVAVFFQISASSRVPPEDYVKTFIQGMRELEQLQNKHFADLLSAGSEVHDLTADADPKAAEEGSREELEDDKDQPAGSASQEKDVKDSSQDEKDDDDDDDDDIDDALSMIPVRGLPGLFGFHSLFGMNKPWWTGPNVCIEKDEKEEKDESSTGGDFLIFGSAHFSNCLNSPEKYTCKTVTKRNGVTKTSTVTYQCCHGFKRLANSQNCTKVETKPLTEIASELGADEFTELVRNSGLEKELEGKVTVFLPTNKALEDHHRGMDSLNAVDPVLTNEVPLSGNAPSKSSGKSFIQSHVVDGIHMLSDLSDEEVLTTMDNTTLRVNFLPGRGGVAVNCIKLNVTDQLTKDGVVHLVESVIPTAREPLSALLSEERFSKFRKELEDNGLWEMMSGDKPITVFAVENEGVDKISKKHQTCMKSILAHHILPHTLCSAMGDSGERLATMDVARGWLPFTNKDGVFTIGNGTKVTSADKLATNGLLHVAQDFVLPSGGRTVSELLNYTDHGEWLGVLEKSELLQELEMLPEMLMFVPTDKAVKEAKLDELSLSELKDLVRYHIGESQSRNTVKTLLPGQNLTISSEKSIIPGLLSRGGQMSVQCSPLTRVGGKVCNGLLHEVGSVLRPPTQSLWEFIQNGENLGTLRKVLEGTKLEEEMKSGSITSVTFLAPNDSAFEGVTKENLDNLLTDKDFADQILRSHIVKEPICCENAVPNSWPFVATSPTLVDGRPVEINRRDDKAIFGSLVASDCDHIVKEGVVHLVSGVRLGHQRQPDRELIIRKPNSEIILAGI